LSQSCATALSPVKQNENKSGPTEKPRKTENEKLKDNE
jgi:hypothetical protein